MEHEAQIGDLKDKNRALCNEIESVKIQSEEFKDQIKSLFHENQDHKKKRKELSVQVEELEGQKKILESKNDQDEDKINMEVELKGYIFEKFSTN